MEVGRSIWQARRAKFYDRCGKFFFCAPLVFGRCSIEVVEVRGCTSAHARTLLLLLVGVSRGARCSTRVWLWGSAPGTPFGGWRAPLGPLLRGHRMSASTGGLWPAIGFGLRRDYAFPLPGGPKSCWDAPAAPWGFRPSAKALRPRAELGGTGPTTRVFPCRAAWCRRHRN